MRTNFIHNKVKNVLLIHQCAGELACDDEQKVVCVGLLCPLVHSFLV